ncbi:serine/threonine protein kinase [Actinomadura craniellae]|uniref:non-specific serine/threonine protein kinase n=1 Tax=Actinomadura craniellae TaxID=2231787 RepID=A0A365H8Q3_9ACTN|nr:serine/threonine-protein kinase [Actinomadura craniellae]RAY14643.1 serine/threonine protein kinase [Actinomadura craniellae]
MSAVVLNDRYRLDDRLATGGMGEVWRATDTLLDRIVAVKLLRQEYVSDAAALARFQAEARFAAAVQHGGIAQIYDYGEHEDRAYLVMELVPGEPLSKILRRIERLDAQATLDLMAQVARALHVAHEANIVHRDIKPANLMITEGEQVKITDFGIARGLEVSGVTQTGMVMGTAHYVAPEQASGQPVGPATDLYALGVVAYECLAGHPPFQGDTAVAIALQHVREPPPELPEIVPEPVRDLIRALLAKEPDDRPADAREVAERAYLIRESLALGDDTINLDLGRGTDTLPSESEEESGQRRSALMYTSVAVGILLLGLIVIGSLWRGPATAGLMNEDDGRGRPLPADPAQPDPSVGPVPSGGVPQPTPPTTSRNPYGGATTSPSPSASPSRKPNSPPTPTDPRPPDPPSSPPNSEPPQSPDPDPSPSDDPGAGANTFQE